MTVILSSRDKPAPSSGASTPSPAPPTLSKEDQRAKAAEKLAARAAKKKEYEAKVAAGELPVPPGKQTPRPNNKDGRSDAIDEGGHDTSDSHAT